MKLMMALAGQKLVTSIQQDPMLLVQVAEQPLQLYTQEEIQEVQLTLQKNIMAHLGQKETI